MPVVYQHTRLDTNEIFYIGIGKAEARAHTRHGRNEYWNAVTDSADYKVDIVARLDTTKECAEMERNLIIANKDNKALTNVQHNKSINSNRVYKTYTAEQPGQPEVTQKNIDDLQKIVDRIHLIIDNLEVREKRLRDRNIFYIIYKIVYNIMPRGIPMKELI